MVQDRDLNIDFDPATSRSRPRAESLPEVRLAAVPEPGPRTSDLTWKFALLTTVMVASLIMMVLHWSIHMAEMSAVHRMEDSTPALSGMLASAATITSTAWLSFLACLLSLVHLKR